MVVIVKHINIWDDYENKVGVSPFTPDYQALEKLFIVYVVPQYTFQYKAKVYALMFRNSLSLPWMDNKLIMSFIMIKAGLVVKDTAKISTVYQSVEDQSTHFSSFGICITLFLHGVLSYCCMWLYLTDNHLLFYIFLLGLEKKVFLPSFYFFGFRSTMYYFLLCILLIWSTSMKWCIPLRYFL